MVTWKGTEWARGSEWMVMSDEFVGWRREEGIS